MIVVDIEIHWNWLGDHLALDVANTVRVTDGVCEELLPSPSALDRWRTVEPQELPGPATFDQRDLTRFRELRDAALTVKHAAVGANPLPTRESATIDRLAEAASVRRLLTPPGARPRFRCPPRVSPMTQLLGVGAAAVIDLVGRDDLANLAVCPAPDCGQFFHRARPNQRWCSSGCGNRAGVDRHRHRRQAVG